MDRLWAPWRMEYLLGKSDEECPFCNCESSVEDCARLILHRGEHAFVVMNKFPYSNGHLMVVPYRHIANYDDLTEEEALDMHRLLKVSHNILLEVVCAQGFNVGLNLGQVAGAGIASHLHMHIVPRWSGDTNFMPVFGDVRIIPQHLEATFELLSKAFERYREGQG